MMLSKNFIFLRVIQVGGDFLKRKLQLLLFWRIGKFIYLKQNTCENVINKYSTFLIYRYGMSDTFSRSNIAYMKRLYVSFPIYFVALEKLSFDHYKLLVNISEMKRRYFYFRLSIFCRSTVDELRFNIINNLYDVISEDSLS